MDRSYPWCNFSLKAPSLYASPIRSFESNFNVRQNSYPPGRSRTRQASRHARVLAGVRCEQGGEVSEIWVEGSSATEKLNWWRQAVNLLKHGHVDGYFVGTCQWTDVIESEPKTLLHAEQSEFGYVSVYQFGDFRVLETDSTLHSVSYIGMDGTVETDKLVLGYIPAMVSAALGFGALQCEKSRAKTSVQEVACLGVGGGSLPAFLGMHIPGTLVHAVDIDPVVVSCACRHMGLPSSYENLNIVTADAIEFMEKRRSAVQEGKGNLFSSIFLDVYNSSCEVPHSFAATGFLQTCRDTLLSQGALVVNLLNGEAGSERRAAMAAFVRKVLTVFEHVFTVRVNGMPQNIILVAVASRRETLGPGANPIPQIGGFPSTWHNNLSNGEATRTGPFSALDKDPYRPQSASPASSEARESSCAGSDITAAGSPAAAFEGPAFGCRGVHGAVVARNEPLCEDQDLLQPFRSPKGKKSGTDVPPLDAAGEIVGDAAHVVYFKEGVWRSRDIQEKARAAGGVLEAAFDMGDEMRDIFKVETDGGVWEGFVEIQI